MIMISVDVSAEGELAGSVVGGHGSCHQIHRSSERAERLLAGSTPALRRRSSGGFHSSNAR